MKPTTDFRRVMLYATLLLGLTGSVYWCSRPQPGVLPPARSLSEKALDPERQLVLLRVDSLATLLNALETQQPGVFSWTGAEGGSTLTFSNEGDMKQFESFFLAGAELKVFANQQNNPIRPDADGKGFSVPVETRNEVRLVRLPAQMIQSLQLTYQNTR